MTLIEANSLIPCLASNNRPSLIKPPIYLKGQRGKGSGVIISEIKVPPEVLITYDVPVTIIINNTGPGPVWNVTALIKVSKGLQVLFQPQKVIRLEPGGWTTVVALIHPLKEGTWNLTAELYVGRLLVDVGSVSVKIYSVYSYALERGLVLPSPRLPPA
ncbi:MAG: hypothetical protein B6U69_02180 [Thermofilum sp. ex4484_15]|nr:MAG: hypothetical protein B6U69_02180 [Thermofilum sp. ex4484_15]